MSEEALLERIEGLEARLAAVEDAWAIQNLKSRYGQLAASRYGRDGVVARPELERIADELAGLFTEDAVYDPQTAGGEWEGIEEIVARWQEVDDDEDNWDFEWLPLVETDDLAIVTARTRYFEPELSYRNLFIIRFADDGRCSDFTEWYIEEEPG